MSSKFFTWTKGDRRAASDALRSSEFVPIPAECISIKGMDYARTARGSSKLKRPTPLSIEGSPQPSSKHSSRTHDSIALHDAAVQSATSLMTVINDMLRSPPLSAHLFSQGHPDVLRPMHGRPRSRTVPSTPLVEAPMTSPAELPGSFPLDKKPSIAHFSLEGQRRGYISNEAPANALFGPSIIRPHSSPQEATHPMIDDSNMRTPRFSPKSTLPPPSQPSPRSRSAGPHSNAGASLPIDCEEETLVASQSNALTLATDRPSLSNMLDDALKSDSLPPSIADSRNGSSHTIPQLSSQDEQAGLDQTSQADSEAMLMQQISSLRASHDAHICSLKEAHERDIASHRSYISFLESRRGPPSAPLMDGKHALTIDTSHSIARTSELPTSEASANTLQSFELSLDNQKRASIEACQSVEALKRKLSLCRKAQADAVDVRRERDQLREANARGDRRVLQLKDIVRKAKENEKAMKNAAADLDARLVLANNERTDVLEGYHEACARLQNLAKERHHITKELEQVRNKDSQKLSDEIPNDVKDTIDMAQHNQTSLDDGTAVAKDCNALWQQVQELRRTLSTKDAHIRRLEEVVSASSNEGRSAVARSIASQSSSLFELHNSLEEHKQMLATAQAESERYNSLLHNELRRQTRSAAERMTSDTPKLEAEAFVVASEKMMRIKVQSKRTTTDGTTTNSTPEPLNRLLEREIEHCIKEIIMYKADLKTCKKDLKKAQAQVESLRAMQLHRPPTPDGESANSGKSAPSPRMPRSVPVSSPNPLAEVVGTPDSGLGISLPGSHHTPTRTVAAATTSALLSPTPAPKSTVASSPALRPKSPLGTHKKLPKPPPSPYERPLPATPPPPSIKLHRNETLRSLSESIISSYTKRPPVEEGVYTTPLSRERSSAPLQSLGSPMAPVSKFATPRRTPTPKLVGEK